MARNPLALLALLGLILVGLSLTAGGCDGDVTEVKAALNAYYDAVGRGDSAGQAGLWLPDRQGEASQETEAWARRSKDMLKLAEVHIEQGSTPDQRLVHVTLSFQDSAQPGQRRYESKVLVLQSAAGGWLIRDVR